MTTKTTRSKKKASSKKAPAKLTADSMLVPVKDSRTPTMELRARIKRAVPASGIKASELMAKTDCQMRTLVAMLKRGFIEVR